MAETTPLTNPFPGADDPTWRQHLAEAITKYAGWPIDISEDVAAFIVRPKDLLTRAGGEYRLRDEVIERRTYESGVVHHVLKARAHGFMGSPTEYNERVRSNFAAPAAPGSHGPSLPRLVTVRDESDEPLAVLTTEDPVTEAEAQVLFDITDRSMVRANGKRPWDLPGDLMLHGQAEPSLHAVIVRKIEDADGDIIEIADTMAITGNNRSQARQQCLGLGGGTHMGVAPSIAGWNPSEAEAETHYFRPAAWAPRYANLLRRAWEEPAPGDSDAESRAAAHELAREGGKLAVVPAEFVLSVTDPDGQRIDNFERVVWEPNRTSHRRQPLEYDPLERATAEVRALLSAAVAAKLVGPEEAEWLAGDAPVPAALVQDDGLTNADVRDMRDLRLLRLIFPGRGLAGDVVRQTLGEPASRHTQKAHVVQRHRLATAAITVGYAGEAWNEQMNDGLLPARAIRAHWTPQDRSAATLLRLARRDSSALEEFINTRGLNWLASHELVFADRGSIGKGAKTAGLVRRTPSNMRAALLKKPETAIGLFQEIRRASGRFGLLERAPRQVDEDGRPIKGTVADAQWFLATFPKSARARTPEPDPGKTRPKKMTKHEVLARKREDFAESAFDGLGAAVAAIFKAGDELAAAAVAAGEPGFTEAQMFTVDRLREMFTAVRQDARTLISMLDDLGDDSPSLDDIECRSAHYIDLGEDQYEQSDEDDEDDEDGAA